MISTRLSFTYRSAINFSPIPKPGISWRVINRYSRYVDYFQTNFFVSNLSSLLIKYTLRIRETFCENCVSCCCFSSWHNFCLFPIFALVKNEYKSYSVANSRKSVYYAGSKWFYLFRIHIVCKNLTKRIHAKL